MTRRALQLGRFGLLENPTGYLVTWQKGDRTMLADVTDCYYRELPAAFMLKVRHFNGDPLPDIAVSAVKVVEP